MGFQDLSTVGCIHGRFQPFHLGHVDYLKAALTRWHSVIVGLAAPTPVPLSFPGVEHRNLASANPLTYIERLLLIRGCCRELGIPDERIEFAPFPIDEPQSLRYFIGKNVVCATTRLYDWNDEKIRRLEDEGYRVEVMNECIKSQFDGRAIRKFMVDGSTEWHKMVQPSVVRLLTAWEVGSRIRTLSELDVHRNTAAS